MVVVGGGGGEESGRRWQQWEQPLVPRTLLFQVPAAAAVGSRRGGPRCCRRRRGRGKRQWLRRRRQDLEAERADALRHRVRQRVLSRRRSSPSSASLLPVLVVFVVVVGISTVFPDSSSSRPSKWGTRRLGRSSCGTSPFSFTATFERAQPTPTPAPPASPAARRASQGRRRRWGRFDRESVQVARVEDHSALRRVAEDDLPVAVIALCTRITERERWRTGHRGALMKRRGSSLQKVKLDSECKAGKSHMDTGAWIKKAQACMQKKEYRDVATKQLEAGQKKTSPPKKRRKCR